MEKLTLEIEAPDLICDLIKKAVGESEKTTIIPDSILPGYRVTVRVVED